MSTIQEEDKVDPHTEPAEYKTVRVLMLGNAYSGKTSLVRKGLRN